MSIVARTSKRGVSIKADGADAQALFDRMCAPTAETVKTDIVDVARAVAGCDAFALDMTVEQVAHLVEIALKTVIGVNCLGGRKTAIDLGNGHLLLCSLVARDSHPSRKRNPTERSTP